MKIYLVGGAVRDMLLGRDSSDRDFAFQGSDADFLLRFPDAKRISRSFPVFWLHGREFAPLRGGTIDEDLAARDLTVNGLALETCPSEAPGPSPLHAHPKALDDLRARVLRPCSGEAMEQDPLRVFRAARFAAQLPDFSIHPELSAAMRKVSADGLLHGLFAERVCAELRKALAAPAPDRFLSLLHETGCLVPWFAELARAGDIPAGPAQYHGGSVLDHTLEVMRFVSDHTDGATPEVQTGAPSDNVSNTRAMEPLSRDPSCDPLRVWMGLVHDLGKCATPAGTLPRHPGHELPGAEMALALGRRLALPQRYIRAGELAALLHMVCSRYPEIRPGTRVDLLVRLDAAGLVDELFDLAYADRCSGKRADEAVHHGDAARLDLARIKAVELPEKWRNMGAESGERLRQLRCELLSHQGSPRERRKDVRYDAGEDAGDNAG